MYSSCSLFLDPIKMYTRQALFNQAEEKPSHTYSQLISNISQWYISVLKERSQDSVLGLKLKAFKG